MHHFLAISTLVSVLFLGSPEALCCVDHANVPAMIDVLSKAKNPNVSLQDATLQQKRAIFDILASKAVNDNK